MRGSNLWKVSVAFFMLSLILPSYYAHDWPENSATYGVEVLAFGWFGIIGAEPRWFANVIYFYVVGCLSSLRYIRFKFLFVLLLILTAVSVLVSDQVGFSRSNKIPDDFHFSVGAYIWSLSLLVAAYSAMKN